MSDDAYLLTCGRYIEINPVRAALADRPEGYPWSSYHARTLGVSNPLLDEDPAYAALGGTAAQRQGVYRAWVAAAVPVDEWPMIRTATQKGLMIGPLAFQQEIETVAGRRLVGELRGRPRKVVAHAR